MVFAQEESRLLNHDYIGTEHLLLGLLAESDGIAARSLGDLGISHDDARVRVEEMVGRGEAPSEGHIPFTADAKKTLEMGLRESIGLGHRHIGTEHILLGLLAMPDTIACQAVESMGVDPERLRRKVAERVAGSGERIVMEPPWTPSQQEAPGRLLTLRHEEPALASLLFLVVALVVVQIVPPTPEIARWGLAGLLGGVLLWAGGAVIGTGPASGSRARGMGRGLRLLGALTLAAAASLFVLGALLG